MMIAQLSGVVGSGVPSLVAPMGDATTMVTICLAFLVACVLVMVLGHRGRAA